MWLPQAPHWQFRNYATCIVLVLALCSLLGCTRKVLAPLGGAVAGGAVGSVVGGPVGAGVGAGVGYGSGAVYDWAKEDAVGGITNAQMVELLHEKLDGHKDGQMGLFAEIKRLLLFVAVGLGVYLSIPLFFNTHTTRKLCEKGLK